MSATDRDNVCEDRMMSPFKMLLMRYSLERRLRHKGDNGGTSGRHGARHGEQVDRRNSEGQGMACEHRVNDTRGCSRRSVMLSITGCVVDCW